MTRPGYGTAGENSVVHTNFFQLTISDRLVAHQYSICIWRKKRQTKFKSRRDDRNPPKTPPQGLEDYEDIASLGLIDVNRAIFRLVMDKYKRNINRSLAYDGRSIAYSSGEVHHSVLATKLEVEAGPEGVPTPEEIREGRAGKVYMTIEHAKSLQFHDVIRGNTSSLSSTEYLTCLDLALAGAATKQYIQVGRSFFNPHGAKSLGKGGATASAWMGFYQSVRLSEMGLVLNMDQSCTAFWNYGGQDLLALIRTANGNRDLYANAEPRYMRLVSTAIKGVRVRAKHTGITYRVYGMSPKSADSFSFTTQEGKSVTISQYFASQYNIRLRHGNLSCVKVHPKRDTLMPAEMLTILPNQRVVGLLNADQTQSMVQFASSRPDVRKRAAETKMRELNHSNDNVCKEFGVQVDPNLVRAQARVLPVPRIQYQRKEAHPDKGWWSPNGPMVYPMDLSSWAVINTAQLHDDGVRDFLREFLRAATKAGMQVRMPDPYRINVHPDSVTHAMKKMVSDHQRDRNKKGLQLLVIIRDRKDAQFYNKVKRVADIELGVASQVLQASLTQKVRGRDMYCNNVILKVNAKLGGLNNIVKAYGSASTCPDVGFLEVPHIILGADVTHPGGGGDGPSVAALTGSRDKQSVQFSGSIRCQAGKQEVIGQLGEMFKEVYKQWLANFQGKYRAVSIVMFRDGVSEGQFEEVMQVEVAALRRAYMEMHPGLKEKVKITYIIVTKRHHTRFFPTTKQHSDKSGNVKPGTVVDRGITSKDFYDFYLNSHAGIQGTSKPSKYTVLIDENKIGVDALQGYVFRLAHGFVRCNRSVSMVNSAYYAHLLAFRGRAYLGEDGSDNGSVVSGSGAMPTLQVHAALQRRLYWV